ncbi:MAG: nucleotidyltransferase domain-containing protein [Elusimicrobiota bacterium]
MKNTTEQVINFLSAKKDLLKKEFKIKKIGIFGSYAKGEIREGSDIDIAVELEKADLFYLIGIKQFVEEALGARVDVIRLRENMNKTLKKEIEQSIIYV